MPILTANLDPHGHALVDVLVRPTAARVKSLLSAGQPAPAPTSATAMIDTGAQVTAIDPAIRQALGLVPYRVHSFHVPGIAAPVRAPYYRVDLYIMHPAGFHHSLSATRLDVLEAAIAHLGTKVLIGCDVLSRCQMLYNGVAGTFTLSY